MRPSSALSLAVAATGSQVAAQVTLTSSPPTTTLTPVAPPGSPPYQGDAPAVRNNPLGVAYEASFPKEPFFKAAYPDGGNIQGKIVGVANPDGVGVSWTIKWTNLPKSGGPFMYHLHVAPVPENGNCTATLAHLDPFIRHEDPVCDKSRLQTCQTGDLSGKFGDIPEGKDTFEAKFVDLYSSTIEGLGSFFGNRSVVFHYANKTRVSCANFVKVTDDHGKGGHHGTKSACTSTAKPTGTGNATTTTGTTTASPTGAATTTGVVGAGATGLKATGVAGVIAFGAAIMFML